MVEVRKSLGEFMELLEVYGAEYFIHDIISWEDADFRDDLARVYLDFIEEPTEADIWEELEEFGNYEEWATNFLIAMSEDSRQRLLDKVIRVYDLVG